MPCQTHPWSLELADLGYGILCAVCFLYATYCFKLAMISLSDQTFSLTDGTDMAQCAESRRLRELAEHHYRHHLLVRAVLCLWYKRSWPMIPIEGLVAQGQFHLQVEKVLRWKVDVKDHGQEPWRAAVLVWVDGTDRDQWSDSVQDVSRVHSGRGCQSGAGRWGWSCLQNGWMTLDLYKECVCGDTAAQAWVLCLVQLLFTIAWSASMIPHLHFLVCDQILASEAIRLLCLTLEQPLSKPDPYIWQKG